jgi:hypothetical protein
VADSRISARAPLRILCQHDGGSCAACCGVYNFVDRAAEATETRLRRRTDRVRQAWPNVEELRIVRDELLALERPEVLFSGVKVCPFAGYVEEGRVGCLLHPSRHPTGEDLRDLAVYPKEVCAGHFCAPHDWLRPVEMDLAQTARGLAYGRVVTDAGLVKAIGRALGDVLGRPLRTDDVTACADALAALWHALLESWPWRDPDPARFGGFAFDGDEAVERTLPTCLAGIGVDASAAERTILDALGTRALDASEALDALKALRQSVAAVVAGR